MTQIDRMEAVDDHWCREDFAEALIRRLGVDEAVEACRTNLWHGILKIVLKYQDRPREHRERHHRGNEPDWADRGLDSIGYHPCHEDFGAVRYGNRFL